MAQGAHTFVASETKKHAVKKVTQEVYCKRSSSFGSKSQKPGSQTIGELKYHLNCSFPFMLNIAMCKVF